MDRYICLLFVGITIINVMPFILHFDVSGKSAERVENIGIQEDMRDDRFIQMLVFSLTITVPMLVDMLCGLAQKDSFYFVERVVLIIVCNMTSAAFYFNQHMDSPQDLFASLFGSQTSIITGVLLDGLLKSKLGAWTPRQVRVGFLFYIGSQLYVYLPRLTSFPLKIVLNICYAISVAMFAVALGRYVYRAFPGGKVSQQIDSNEYLPIFCLVLQTAYHVTLGIGFGCWHVKYLQAADIHFIMFLVIVTSAITVLCTVLPGRLARSKINEMEQSLAMKKSFIRYIGHEIRTPLNVSSIGLDILLSGTETAAAAFTIATARQNSSPELAVQQFESGSRKKAYTPTDFTPAGSSKHLHKQSSFGLSLPLGSRHSSKVQMLGHISTDHHTSNEKNTAENNHVLQEVRNAVGLATDILNDLLLYDKLDTDNVQLERTEVNVAELVKSTMAMFAIQATAKNIEFSVQVEDQLPVLRGDEFKLRQVLCNLASNALKFTPENGRVNLSVSTIGDDVPPVHSNNGATEKVGSGVIKKQLQIQCVDNGIGITKENLTKLFKNIVQFDANVNQEGNGSGLGLFITRGLVELHQGTVNVHSNGLGKGCTFTVCLPFDASDNEKECWFRSTACATWTQLCRLGGAVVGKKVQIVHNHVKVVPLAFDDNDVEAGKPAAAITTVGRPGSLTLISSGSNLVGSFDAGQTSSSSVDVPHELTSTVMMMPLARLQLIDESRDSNDAMSASSMGESKMTMVTASSVRPSPSRQQFTRNKSIQNNVSLLVGLTGLVVDDSKSSMKMVVMLLKKLGCGQNTAVDGVEAVNYIKEAIASKLEEVDFILMDNCMPNMSGVDACREIRRLGYGGPIIGLTGHTLDEDVACFRNAGANHVLAKPLDIAALQSCLSDMIPLVKERLQLSSAL
jgi:signal transduction histidine kinase/CheY-like chemotaxis protein